MVKKIIVLLILMQLWSCNSSKAVVVQNKKKTVKKEVVHTKPPSKPTVNTNENQVELVATSSVKTYEEEIKVYIANFQEVAKNNMKTHGIPASITLAQGILESGAGKGKLAITANNHFGIKCHTGWNGDSVKHDDDAEQECFRKYTHASESYRDHSLFLTSRSRYDNLFKLDIGDYEAWARGLKAAGYATDKKYPDKLIGLINRFELYQYDNEVLQRNYSPTKKEEWQGNANELYTIQKGDTLYSLSKKFNLSVDDLKRINNLSENAINVGQKLKIK